LPPPDTNGMCYLLTRGGRDALAYADAHGTWIRWFADSYTAIDWSHDCPRETR
jgi:hypothetical protein